MLIIAILATGGAVFWSLLVLFANGMSDNVSGGFQGAWTVIAAWIAVAMLWLAWWSP